MKANQLNDKSIKTMQFNSTQTMKEQVAKEKGYLHQKGQGKLK